MNAAAESRATMLAECHGLRADVLSEARFLVVGAGALGAEVLKGLALMGAGLVVIVDPDRVEGRNLARGVLYDAHDVGRLKVHAACGRLGNWAPECRFVPVAGDVRFDVGRGVLRRVDAVVSCLDNRGARLVLGRRCAEVDVPWLDGAISETAARVTAFWPSRGGCYECTLTPAQWEEIAAEGAPGCGVRAAAARAAGKVPTTPVTSSLAGALLVHDAIQLAHTRRDAPPAAAPRWGVERYLVVPTGRTVETRYSREPGCESHASWAAVNERPELSSADRLDTVADAAAALAGDRVVAWEPGYDLVTALWCPGCRHRERPFLPARSRLIDARCPGCGRRRPVDPVRHVRIRTAAARRPLWDLGIAPLEVLTFVTHSGRRVHVEITGDLARFPASLGRPLPFPSGPVAAPSSPATPPIGGRS